MIFFFNTETKSKNNRSLPFSRAFVFLSVFCHFLLFLRKLDVIIHCFDISNTTSFLCFVQPTNNVLVQKERVSSKSFIIGILLTSKIIFKILFEFMSFHRAPLSRNSLKFWHFPKIFLHI